MGVACVVRESLPSNMRAAEWCTAARGRRPAGSEDGREVCVVDQVAVRPGSAPPPGASGFYYDTSADPSNPGCTRRISYTAGDAVPAGAEATLQCVQAQRAPTPTGGTCGVQPVGGACTLQRFMGAPCTAADQTGCYRGTEAYLESGSPDCRSGACVVYRYDEATDRAGGRRDDHVYCTCRCGVPEALASTVDPRSLCTCGAGFRCVALAGAAHDPPVRGSYCVRAATVSP